MKTFIINLIAEGINKSKLVLKEDPIKELIKQNSNFTEQFLANTDNNDKRVSFRIVDKRGSSRAHVISQIKGIEHDISLCNGYTINTIDSTIAYIVSFMETSEDELEENIRLEHDRNIEHHG